MLVAQGGLGNRGSAGQPDRPDRACLRPGHRRVRAGEVGMMELVALAPCGYCTTSSFLLNSFTVPLPPDTTPMRAEG